MGFRKGSPIMKGLYKFSAPTPLEFVRKRGTHQEWLFRCACGVQFTALLPNVKCGNTKSCGCHQRSVLRRLATTHGKSKTREYRNWHNMMRRCYDKDNKSFQYYGGRGIKICRRWHVFVNFYNDMGNAPLGMTIERKNNNGPYSPANCGWATRKEQMRNTRQNHYLQINGERRSLIQWAALTQIPYHRILSRVRNGWTGAKIIAPGDLRCRA